MSDKLLHIIYTRGTLTHFMLREGGKEGGKEGGRE